MSAPTQSPIMTYFRKPENEDEDFMLRMKIDELYLSAAEQVERLLPGSAEKTVALRKLLESKDAALRAGGIF